ncbi:DASS family sodium-coupled anion symporter [Acidaminococcus fermentans]|uniref:SLC13 family permease n=1 Tax=Acidaminococcus fermentans TaxID=905 RepID=UPI00242E1B77|nr:DASS family sodium-coupled anion symporter [Acidaminococcus fermentans]
MHLSLKQRFSLSPRNCGLPLALFLALAAGCLPLDGLTPAGQETLALFLFIFVLFLTEALPLAVTTLLVIPLASLLQLAPLKTLLQPFASPVLFLLLGGFLLAGAILQSGLARRLTFLVLLRIGATARRITLGIVLANVLLAFLIPSTTARAAILLPPCLSIIELFRDRPCRKFAANLLLTLTTTCSTISAGILTGTITNPVVNEFLNQQGMPSYSYLEWLELGFLPALLLTFGSWALIQKLYPPESSLIPGGKQYLRQELEKMGPMDRRQKKVLLVFLLAIFFWMTGDLFQIDATTTCLASALLLLLPGVGGLTWKEASSHINYDILLVAGGGISLGNLLMENGTAAWLANQAFACFSLQQASPLLFLTAVLLLCQFLHIFFVGTTVMCTTLIPIVLALSLRAGFPARLAAYEAGMIISGGPVLMFYCTTPSILVHGTGKLPADAFLRTGIPISLLACLIYILWGLWLF